MDTEEKSRRERRKEARLAKNKKKFDSWIQLRQSGKLKKPIEEFKHEDEAIENCTRQPQVLKSEGKLRNLKSKEGVTFNNRNESVANARISKKGLKRKNGSSKSSKHFIDYVGMHFKENAPLGEDDLSLERRLAKKLKVKNGKLRPANDDIDELLDGLPSFLDYHWKNEGIPQYIENGENRYSANKDVGVGISFEKGGEESDSEIASDTEDDDLMEEEFLEMNSNRGRRRIIKNENGPVSVTEGGNGSGEADRKLAKKLKVKGDDVHISPKKIKNSNLSEQGQMAERISNSNIRPSESRETSPAEMASEKSPEAPTAKYVAPHLRFQGGKSDEYGQVRKQVRGLLNKLSETNVESISRDIYTLFNSVGRSVASQIISEEIVTSCSGGPRGSEQYAAVFAAFVAGITCLVGIDFGAKLLARLAKCFEEEYVKEDNLSLRNLTLLLSYLYVFGICSSELMYDFLIKLGKRLTEVDVSTVLTVLHCCGMKLRGEDPVGMKNFILSVQSRANELKGASGNGQSNTTSKRMEFMLETICDIKNNKKRSNEDTPQHTRVKKWLQKLKVDDILIRGLTWSTLLDPEKKGQWWLSGEIASTKESVKEFAGTIDKEIPETKKMLELAAAQRMNTDARRAIFCVIMSGEDYIDAFEKLLRLDLQGKQDREIMRILVECCLQEKVFNKYYCVLATKLCSHDKNHKFTLQYCLWDHFKELDSMTLIRSMHLAKFTAEMIASFSLSLAVLKAVDFYDLIHLSPKKIMHFRMLFEAIFEFSDNLVWNIFTRIGAAPEYESLRNGIEFFISKYVVSNQKSLADKFKIAKKALKNVEGVVM